MCNGKSHVIWQVLGFYIENETERGDSQYGTQILITSQAQVSVRICQSVGIQKETEK